MLLQQKTTNVLSCVGMSASCVVLRVSMLPCLCVGMLACLRVGMLANLDVCSSCLLRQTQWSCHQFVCNVMCCVSCVIFVAYWFMWCAPARMGTGGRVCAPLRHSLFHASAKFTMAPRRCRVVLHRTREEFFDPRLSCLHSCPNLCRARRYHRQQFHWCFFSLAFTFLELINPCKPPFLVFSSAVENQLKSNCNFHQLKLSKPFDFELCI